MFFIPKPERQKPKNTKHITSNKVADDEKIMCFTKAKNDVK